MRGGEWDIREGKDEGRMRVGEKKVGERMRVGNKRMGGGGGREDESWEGKD